MSIVLPHKGVKSVTIGDYNDDNGNTDMATGHGTFTVGIARDGIVKAY